LRQFFRFGTSVFYNKCVIHCFFRREFATRLFSFLRFTIAGHEIRTSLWQALLPPGAIAATTAIPESSNGTAKKTEKLNFEQLGRKFELNAGSIRAAIASAVSEAAMRPGADKSGTGECIFSARVTCCAGRRNTSANRRC
jgi:hypothetical protein